MCWFLYVTKVSDAGVETYVSCLFQKKFNFLEFYVKYIMAELPDITMSLDEVLEIDYSVEEDDPSSAVSISSSPSGGKSPKISGLVERRAIFQPNTTGRHKLDIANRTSKLIIDVTKIPNKNKLFAWWDFSDESRVVKNGNGGLTGIKDKSGNGLDLTDSDAIGTAIDEYGSVTLNGKKGAEVKDNSSGGGWERSSWGISDPFTFYAVMGFNQSSYDASGNREIFRQFDSNVGGSNYGQFDEKVTDQNDYRVYNSSSLYAGATVTTNIRLYGGIYDGSNSKIFVGDTVNSGGISSFSGTSDAISIMRNDSQTTFGRVFEIVFYEGRPENYTEFKSYVNDKYGI